MRPRLKRFARHLAVGLVAIVVLVLTLFGLVLFAVETPWGKNQIRAFIVRQANDYLTATLEIGDLTGSLLRGVELSDIRLSRDEDTIVSVGAVSLSYSIRELLQTGLVIRQIRVDPSARRRAKTAGREMESRRARETTGSRTRSIGTRPSPGDSVHRGDRGDRDSAGIP